MEDLVIPRVELAMKSANASSSRDVGSTVPDSYQKNFSGSIEDLRWPPQIKQIRTRNLTRPIRFVETLPKNEVTCWPTKKSLTDSHTLITSITYENSRHAFHAEFGTAISTALKTKVRSHTFSNIKKTEKPSEKKNDLVSPDTTKILPAKLLEQQKYLNFGLRQTQRPFKTELALEILRTLKKSTKLTEKLIFFQYFFLIKEVQLLIFLQLSQKHHFQSLSQKTS